MVLLLGIFYKPSGADYSSSYLVSAADTREIAMSFLHEFPDYLVEVASSVLPIVLVFAVFNLMTRRFRSRRLVRITAGFVYGYVGLVLFLTGANVGFMPAGSYLGAALADSRFQFLLIPLAMLVGYLSSSRSPPSKCSTSRSRKSQTAP